MDSTYAAVILLSLLSSITTCLGVALAATLRENPRAIAAGLGFSAGIMILISAFELIPASIAITGIRGALTTMIASAAAVWAARLAIPYLRSARAKAMPDWALKKSAFLVISALILHDVPEGFAMANAYLASPEVGVLVALAIALHNLPEEFAMAVPAVTIRSKRFLFGAALLSALAEPLGAIIGLAAVGVAPSLNAHFLAFAAGAMLFVSIRELIPMAKQYQHLGWFAGGMILSVFVYGLLARITVGQTRLIAQ